MSANTPEEAQFFRTLNSGDEAAIRSFITANPALLDSYDYRNFGATPLTTACFSNRPKLVRLLIELGADPNRRSDWSMGPWSPLHCAMYRHDKPLARVLLENGAVLDVHTAAGLGDCAAVAQLLYAEPERVTERGGDGCHPLHFADTIEMARLLLERGAEIDGRCVDHHSTPVQYLCTCRPEVARFLLSQGALADIFSCITCGDLTTAESLLSAQPELINARINQTYFPPSQEFNVHNVMTFTIGGDATPLHAAAKANLAEAINLLIGKGLSPNTRGGYDQGTALHTAAWYNSVEAAQALVDGGADIETRSGKLHNNTPAGWAIVAGADKVFELLMDRGAQVYEWFLDDAQAALGGQFDQVASSTKEQRQRIWTRLSSQAN